MISHSYLITFIPIVIFLPHTFHLYTCLLTYLHNPTVTHACMNIYLDVTFSQSLHILFALSRTPRFKLPAPLTILFNYTPIYFNLFTHISSTIYFSFSHFLQTDISFLSSQKKVHLVYFLLLFKYL